MRYHTNSFAGILTGNIHQRFADTGINFRHVFSVRCLKYCRMIFPVIKGFRIVLLYFGQNHAFPIAGIDFHNTVIHLHRHVMKAVNAFGGFLRPLFGTDINYVNRFIR